MKLLGYLKTGHKVLDRYVSHLSKEVEPYIKEALLMIDEFDESLPIFETTVKFNKIIGKSGVVAVNDEDDIYYARRKNRKGLSKFVKDRVGEDIDVLTIVLKKDVNTPNQYILITAFFGYIVGPEPFDKHSTKQSLQYWKGHALVGDYFDVDDSTVTTIPPEYWDI